ncbi:hypothetical protein UPYG_G00244080 [Umbra pygmaea]|uniref:SH3 domain-containing protein n=1 Tax=Umbra pygmaea TaxID=75934 RepID=A0ABD0X6H2_UMBPY
MAEGRRRDEDEPEDLRRETRDAVVRRQPRQNNSSGERSERHKDQRLSQGPLSSIRAAIKRTSTGSTSLGETNSRDRRRPEITILSAEPLASNTWFPGASAGFPPPPPPTTIWGSSIPPAIQPPPSYDDVIKEKSKEQVLPPHPYSASQRSVSKTTISTQTYTGPESSVPIQTGSVARRPPKPPRPSYPFTTKPLHVDDTATSTVNTQTPKTSTHTVTHTPTSTNTVTQTPSSKNIVTHTASSIDTVTQTPSSKNIVTHTPTSTNTATHTTSSTNAVAEESKQAAIHPAFLTSDLLTPLTSVPGSQTDQWAHASSVLAPPFAVALTTPSDPSPPDKRPRPRPRTKSSLRPIRREVDVQTLVRLGTTGSQVTETQEVSHQGGKYLQELLEAFSSDDWGFPGYLSNEEGDSDSGGDEEEEEEEEEDMSALRARIQAFEQQQAAEEHGNRADSNHGDGALPGGGRPQPRPRVQAPPKPAPPVAAKPPLTAKPSSAGICEDGGSATVGVMVDTVTSVPPKLTEASLKPTDTPSSAPVPAPRPLLPKKPTCDPQVGEAEESAVTPCLPPRGPVAQRNIGAVGPQERSTVAGKPTPAAPPKPSTELHTTSGTACGSRPIVAQKPSATSLSCRESGHLPASAPPLSQNRRPTVFSKPPSIPPAPVVSKAPSIPPAPVVSKPPSIPPAPVVSKAPSIPPAPVVSKAPSIPPAPAQRKTPVVSTEAQTPLPPRPLGGVKLLPLRPPPIKSVPGRPPPPKGVSSPSTTTANQQATPTASTTPIANKLLGQKTAKKGPPLPPRPKPGHPLYQGYMVNNEKQDVLTLLEQDHPAQKDRLHGDELGEFPTSNLNTTTHLPDHSPPRKDENDQLHPVSMEKTQSSPLSDTNKRQSESISDDKHHSAPQSNLQSSQPSGQNIQPHTAAISGPRCVARFDYEGKEEDELAFSTGDVIALTEGISKDWGCGQIHGRTGVFPLAFTQVVEELPPSAGKRTIAETTSKPMEHSESSDQCVLALYDFPGQTAEDLSFQQGALIRVTQWVDAEWAKGRTQDGREGLFPTAFCTAQPMSVQGRGMAKAQFDFKAESTDELSLKAGDLVTDLESVDDEWFMGDAGGRRGLIPKNYLTLIPSAHT